MPDGTSYTPEEVAKILKISRFTVYELIKRGELAAYRIGRKVRVEASDLDLYKKRSKSFTGPPPVDTPLSPPASDKELVICGQDVILDVLAKHLEKNSPGTRCLRNYVGSMEGLLSLYRGVVHLATAHLWDGDSGEYNIPYVRRLLPGQRTVVINFVYRTEGFYVAPQNPKNIHDWRDLAREDVRFVNREKGSGVRVLLDEQFRRLNLAHHSIRGYDREETSHLAVASCVARGEADVGIGIEKVALQVPGLAFIPLQKERYDLVLRREDLDKPQIQALIPILRSPDFRQEINGMGGYDVSRMGEIIAEL